MLAAFLESSRPCRVPLECSAPAARGQIVGASDGLGHRIRDGVGITPSQDNWQRTGVVIVGGGAAGLTAAWRLLKSGYSDFVLLELEREPGGTARSGASPIVPYPGGAHYLPAPMKENKALVSLLDRWECWKATRATVSLSLQSAVSLPRPRGARVLSRPLVRRSLHARRRKRR